MWLAALAAPTFVFVLASLAIGRQRRRPPALGAPVALALTICFEAVLLNALSAFHAVARGPLLAAHGVVAVVAAGWLGRRVRAGGLAIRPRAAWRASFGHLGAPALLAILAVPVAYSALLYLPNNWDSMTYHLARVAHWVQHRSVAPFATSVARQVTYPPGAEYLLLVLQAVAGTDRLASLVQLASWITVALAAAPLARILGAPRWVAPWAAILFAAAPMALLQASSTQNDLVASAVTVALVTACLPFLHRRPRWRASDLAVLAAVGSAGVLVKPTSLVTAAPVLLWAAAATARALARRRDRWRALARGAASAAVLAVVLLGPELARRVGAPDRGEFAPFLYPPFSELGDRAVNTVREVARHVPLPDAWTSALAVTDEARSTIRHPLSASLTLRAHEDVAGSPGSFLLAAALLLAGFARWRRLPPRARAALFALVAAWVLLCGTFRDNRWIARLHLPLLALAPLASAGLAGIAARSRAVRWSPAVAAALLAAVGLDAAHRNDMRPVPNPVGARFGLLPHNYYTGRQEGWPGHVRAMMAIGESGCDRLGLLIDGDGYDYPLTWRAMQRGISVRHLVGSDAWPCVVYSELGEPPAPPGGGWCPSATAPEVFVKRDSGAPPCRRAGVARR